MGIYVCYVQLKSTVNDNYTEWIDVQPLTGTRIWIAYLTHLPTHKYILQSTYNNNTISKSDSYICKNTHQNVICTLHAALCLLLIHLPPVHSDSVMGLERPIYDTNNNRRREYLKAHTNTHTQISLHIMRPLIYFFGLILFVNSKAMFYILELSGHGHQMKKIEYRREREK